MLKNFKIVTSVVFIDNYTFYLICKLSFTHTPNSIILNMSGIVTRARSPTTPETPLGKGIVKRTPSAPKKVRVESKTGSGSGSGTASRDMPMKKGKITKKNPSAFKKAALAIAKASQKYKEAEARDKEEQEKEKEAKKAEYERPRNGDDDDDAEAMNCHEPDDVDDGDVKISDGKKQKVDEPILQLGAQVDDHVKIIGGPLNGTCGTITHGPVKINKDTLGYFLRTDKMESVVTKAIDINTLNPVCKFQILESSIDKHARVYSEISTLRSEVMAELKEYIPILFEYKEIKEKNQQDRYGLDYYQKYDGGNKKFRPQTHVGRLYYQAQNTAIAAEWKRRDEAGINEPIARDFFTPFEEWVKEFEIQHKRSLEKEETLKFNLVTRLLAKYPLLYEPGLFQVLTKSYRNVAKYGELADEEKKLVQSDPEFKQGYLGSDAWQKHKLGEKFDRSYPWSHDEDLVPSTLNPDCVLHWAMLISASRKACVHEREFHRAIADLEEYWGVKRYKKMLALLMFCAHGLGLVSKQLYLYTELQRLYDIKPDSLTINAYEESLIELFV